MSEPTITPAANSKEAFQAAIAQYKQQHEGLSGQRQQLEANYQQQKTQMDSTLLMLSGAIVAVEQIIKNVDDEAAAKQAEDAKARDARLADTLAKVDEIVATEELQHQPV